MTRPTPLCDKIANALALAPGHGFQDRDAWEKTARAIEREAQELREALGEALRGWAEHQDFPEATDMERIAELVGEMEKALSEDAAALREAEGYLSYGFWEIRPEHRAAIGRARQEEEGK